MKVFLLDNYDSFTYNIAQLIGAIGLIPLVRRSTETSVSLLEDYSPDRIVISPGPMRPRDHGFSFKVIERFAGKVPLLGICLGMQAVNEYFGGKTVKAPVPVHGKTSDIFHSGEGIFRKLPSPFRAARYHSLIVSGVPDVLKPVAFTEEDIPMALMHRDKPVFGVQFHPESYLSSCGKKLMKNFIEVSL